GVCPGRYRTAAWACKAALALLPTCTRARALTNSRHRCKIHSMRTAITSLLMLEMLLNPEVCCCFASRLALQAYPIASACQTKTSSSKPSCCCCPSSSSKEKAKPHAPPAPCPPQDEPDKCPFKLPSRLDNDDTSVALRHLACNSAAALVALPASLSIPL